MTREGAILGKKAKLDSRSTDRTAEDGSAYVFVGQNAGAFSEQQHTRASIGFRGERRQSR